MLIVTLPEVPVYPPVLEVAVKVLTSAFPVYFKPRLVRFATPELKSETLFNLFVPDKPLSDPVKGELTVIVTVLVEALKVVIVLPLASCAVRVFVPVKVTPVVCGLVILNANLLITPGFTSKVLVPVLVPPVTVNVILLPDIVGVTVTPVNSPEVNTVEVPVIPAVPP